jgi:hypothetical protein
MHIGKWPRSFEKPPGLLSALVVLLIFQCFQTIAAPLESKEAAAFLQGLLDHPNSMDEFIDENDLEIARRLGISYPEAPCKPLISWDLPAPARDRLRATGLDGQFIIEELDDQYSRLVLFPDDSTATRSWDFRDGKIVSSILNRVGGWNQVDSPHFRFFVSDASLFHKANVKALESFLAETASLLGLSDTDMDRLSKEKIYYCFCRDQEEIRELTGFAARGMYIVSHDIIVSTYSAHFHELAHLLVNYRLKQPHLYTHPFLLEGFAVAVGGRGGKSPEILHQLGLFLHRSGWVSVDELLDATGFYKLNASMSYPGSAPYNRFLLDHLGVSDYLALYARYGGDAQSVSQMRIPRTGLPTEAEWQRFLAEQPHEGAIGPGAVGLETTRGPVAFQPLPDGTHFGFAVPGITLAFDGRPSEGYSSFLFEQFLDDQPYAGERILIRASSKEVGVYDLYTNTMIAHYASGFSDNIEEIPTIDGRYVFHVDRSVFPADLGNVQCRFIVD